jgi:hypothetical protein
MTQGIGLQGQPKRDIQHNAYRISERPQRLDISVSKEKREVKKEVGRRVGEERKRILRKRRERKRKREKG